MKVKALSRSSSSTQRANSGDLHKRHQNLNPVHHPLQRAREYTRAVQSAKLDRMFAKPFIGSLGNGHRDAVNCTATSRHSLVPFVSGGVDGEVRVWDLQLRREVSEIPSAHAGIVSGLVVMKNGENFLSCGYDGKIRQWKLFPSSLSSLLDKEEEDTLKDGSKNQKQHPCGPLNVWSSSSGCFKSIDYHWREDQFATASDGSVDVWTPERSEPIQSYNPYKLGWGDDSINVIRYNPAEECLLAHCSSDRGIGLHDIRTGSALKKTILSMKANALEWNPMEPMNFVVANEDHNCYSFDMRKLDTATCIHRGHVGAVLSVSWSPTGREFVSGSYDRTIRIFSYSAQKAREIYHLKRMQRVFTVNYSADHRYIISGSDDSNLRLWKARASEQLGQLRPREEKALEYRSSLIQKYKHMPEVGRIHRSRKIPKLIKKQTNIAHIQKESRERKLQNRINHSKPGSIVVVPPKKQAVVNEVE